MNFKNFTCCIFVLILTFIGTVDAQTVDFRLLEYVNGPPGSADKTWKFITNSAVVVTIAEPASMIIIGLAEHNQDLTTKGLETGFAIGTAGVAEILLKDIVKRRRPFLAHPGLIYDKEAASGYSFPSGHSSVAFADATALSLAFPKWYVIAPSFAYASLVSYSRLYLGVHYPSDVAAGALVGAGSAFLTWKLQKILFGKKKHKDTTYHDQQ